METWDSRYPFTAEEAKIFSKLHQKATKFPVPLGIKIFNSEENEYENGIQSQSIDKATAKDIEFIFQDEQTKQ